MFGIKFYVQTHILNMSISLQVSYNMILPKKILSQVFWHPHRFMYFSLQQTQRKRNYGNLWYAARQKVHNLHMLVFHVQRSQTVEFCVIPSQGCLGCQRPWLKFLSGKQTMILFRSSRFFFQVYIHIHITFFVPFYGKHIQVKCGFKCGW